MTYYTRKLTENELSINGIMSDSDYNNNSLPVKHRNVNTFKKVSPQYHKFLLTLLSESDRKYDWKFEFNYSYSPVGIHNDRNYHKGTDMFCDRVMILPINWSNDMIASTIIFQEKYSEKVFRSPNGKFRLDDNTQIDNFLSDEMKLSSEFISSANMDKFTMESICGLSLEYEYIWDKRALFVFDSSNLHCSNQYSEGQYKLSINGLGFK